MQLSIQCPSCDARLQIEQRLLGTRVNCPSCGNPIDLKRRRPKSPDTRVSSVGRSDELVVNPASDEDDEPDTYGVKQVTPPEPSQQLPSRRKTTSSSSTLRPVAGSDGRLQRDREPKKVRSGQSPREASTARGRWLLYGILFATMSPLLFSILVGERDLAERFERSLAENPEVVAELSEDPSRAEVLAALPDGRIKGAHLSSKTWVHWVYAGASLAAFIGLYMALFRNIQSGKRMMLGSALFTATFGIFLLLAFQWVATYSRGVVAARGLVGLVFMVVQLIGYSYSAALDPNNGFIASMLGFTFGVGLCEEVCKAVPVIWFLKTNRHATWRTTCLVGLASGVGFGVSEGVTYSSEFYNGMYGVDIYVVRFVSCVALHSAWAGAAAVLMYFNQSFLPGNADGWGDLLIGIGIYLGVPMLLHGLYDTLLKQQYEVGALLAGLATVGWLIFIVERLQDE